MKKALLLSLFSLITSVSFSQKVRIGLNFSPAIGFNRLTTQTQDPTYDFSKNGAGLKFIAGPEVSFYLTDNYAFTTGLWYVAKGAKIASHERIAGKDSSYTTNLQYIAIPATFKLFTNEIATDMKLYFQLGGMFDIKVGDKVKDVKIQPKSNFAPVDADVLAGAGVEMQLGDNTYFLAGLRYTRGLINTARNSGQFKNLSIKTDLISLDLGIRF